MFTLGVLGDDLVGIIKKFQTNPDQTLQTFEGIQGDHIMFEKRLKFYTLRRFIKLREEYEWFSKLEKTRQNGFYSDYFEMLQNPVNLDSQDYDQAIFRLAKVRYVGISIIDLINTSDEQLIKHFDKIRRLFRDYMIYDKIGTSLSKIRETRGSIFEHISKSLATIFDEPKTLLLNNQIPDGTTLEA